MSETSERSREAIPLTCCTLVSSAMLSSSDKFSRIISTVVWFGAICTTSAVSQEFDIVTKRSSLSRFPWTETRFSLNMLYFLEKGVLNAYLNMLPKQSVQESIQTPFQGHHCLRRHICMHSSVHNIYSEIRRLDASVKLEYYHSYDDSNKIKSIQNIL
jgi:hypothetical protein